MFIRMYIQIYDTILAPGAGEVGMGAATVARSLLLRGLFLLEIAAQVRRLIFQKSSYLVSGGYYLSDTN